MSDLFMLSEKQFNRMKPYFPLSRGVPRMDDLRVISASPRVMTVAPTPSSPPSVSLLPSSSISINES